MIPLLTPVLLALPALASPEEVVLTFGWSPTGSVRVVEHAEVAGQEAETTYLLHWSPLEAERGIRVEYAEFEFLTLNGVDASDPSLEQEMENARAMNAALPALRIGEDGSLLGFEGWEEARRSVLDYLRRRDLPRELYESYAQAVEDPAYQARVKARTGDTWQAWVGALAGQTVTVGVQEEFDVEMDFEGGGGVLARRQVLCRDAGSVAGARRVALTFRTVLDADALRAMIERSAGPGALGAVEPVSRVDEVEGVWEVATLRPIRVRRSSTVTMRLGGRTSEEVEMHAYTFHWPDLVRARRSSAPEADPEEPAPADGEGAGAGG